MPTADATKRDYTAAETQAYERYISAVADHNIVCARSGATTREKMDAAFVMDARFREFCETAGLAIGQPRNPADAARIASLEGEVEKITNAARKVAEAIRSGVSMLHGIESISVFQYLPADESLHDDHNACCTLLDDATTVLRVALREASEL